MDIIIWPFYDTFLKMLSDDLSESKSSIKVTLSRIDGIITMLLEIISVSFYTGHARHLPSGKSHRDRFAHLF